MTPLIPSTLTTADLPVAELACARLDGELFSLAGSWCPIDARDDPETRAIAIGPWVPRRATAERLTAAWLYGLAPEPVEHQFCVPVGARIGHLPGRGLQLREVKLNDGDVQVLGRLPATTPLRTAVDLARWGHHRQQRPEEPQDTGLLAALLAYAGLGRTDEDPRLRTAGVLSAYRGMSFTRLAERRLRDAFGLLGSQPAQPSENPAVRELSRQSTQPSLTRYTS